jgi:DNA-binding SARP family transcriptional activator
MLKLKLFGGLSLTGETVPAAAFQRRRLALLAVLAIGGRRGVSRERVQAYLWPDSTEERARHALDQLLYATRRDVGRDVIVSGTSDLRVNPDRVQPDIWEFHDAIDNSRWLDAVAVYDGPVLQGFHLIDESEFEQWLDTERTRCQHDYHRALEALARTASACSSHEEAVGWWRKRAASDPFSAAAALELMRALVAADDRAGAQHHARVYEEIVRTSLEIEPDESVVSRNR